MESILTIANMDPQFRAIQLARESFKATCDLQALATNDAMMEEDMRDMKDRFIMYRQEIEKTLVDDTDLDFVSKETVLAINTVLQGKEQMRELKKNPKFKQQASELFTELNSTVRYLGDRLSHNAILWNERRQRPVSRDSGGA